LQHLAEFLADGSRRDIETATRAYGTIKRTDGGNAVAAMALPAANAHQANNNGCHRIYRFIRSPEYKISTPHSMPVRLRAGWIAALPARQIEAAERSMDHQIILQCPKIRIPIPGGL